MRTSTIVATDGVPQPCHCRSVMRQHSNLVLPGKPGQLRPLGIPCVADRVVIVVSADLTEWNQDPELLNWLTNLR
jgi:hypothetical protein